MFVPGFFDQLLLDILCHVPRITVSQAVSSSGSRVVDYDGSAKSSGETIAAAGVIASAARAYSKTVRRLGEAH